MSDLSNIKSNLEKYESQFEERTQQIIDLAKRTPPQGSDAWIQMLMNFEVEPLDSQRRAVALKSGFQFHLGALPVEVRSLLTKIKDQLQASAQKQDIENLNGDDKLIAQKRIRKFVDLLDEETDSKLSTYVNSIKPKTSLTSIFANAASSSINHGTHDNVLNTKKCKCCGAARPKDTDLSTCDFCGTPFFNKQNV